MEDPEKKNVRGTRCPNAKVGLLKSLPSHSPAELFTGRFCDVVKNAIPLVNYSDFLDSVL